MHSVPASFDDVFELVVTIRDIEPAIHRRLRVPAAITLDALHDVIQVAFDWNNCHLHEFQVGDIRLAIPDVEDQTFVIDERAAPLGAVARVGSRLLYLYDFGDGWELDIDVVRVTDAIAPAIVCLDGSRASPLEDSGGPLGYMDKLEILANPKHDEYGDLKEWIPRGFKPEKFNLAAINKKLAPLARRLAPRRQIRR